MSASAGMPYEVPRLPASAGALLFDTNGRLLILKPTYKRRWTIPGGQLEADGETPWQACRRETFEECGIEIAQGRLVCVDYRPPKDALRPGGLRFVFHCGRISDAQVHGIALQAEEIAEFRFVDLETAAAMLSGPVSRRVVACAHREQCVYLEDGRPVPGIAN